MEYRKISCLFALGLACVFSTGCVTIKVSPAWKITNVNSNNQPITEGLTAYQLWGYMGLTHRDDDQELDSKGLFEFSEKKLTPDVVRLILANVIVFVIPMHGGKRYGVYGEGVTIVNLNDISSRSLSLDPTDKVRKIKRRRVNVDDDGVVRCTIVWETDKNGKPTKVIKIIQAERAEIEE